MIAQKEVYETVQTGAKTVIWGSPVITRSLATVAPAVVDSGFYCSEQFSAKKHKKTMTHFRATTGEEGCLRGIVRGQWLTPSPQKSPKHK
jgi:hypothetical protein